MHKARFTDYTSDRDMKALDKDALQEANMMQMLREAQDVDAKYNFSLEVIAQALVLVNGEKKLVSQDIEESWKTSYSVKLSAVFRHFSQSCVNDRKWIDDDILRKFKRPKELADQDDQ